MLIGSTELLVLSYPYQYVVRVLCMLCHLANHQDCRLHIIVQLALLRPPKFPYRSINQISQECQEHKRPKNSLGDK
jgi:hypothetical protein